MDFKQLLQKCANKIKSIWYTGKIQRSSRVTYDVFWNVILFFLVIGFVGLFFGAGIGAGYFASLVKDEPIRSYESMERDIYNYEETSKLYFANNVYFGDVNSDLHRKETNLENISQLLIDAVIATEDESFNEHKGVVPKAIVRAVVQEATNADLKSGGSTLTQQIIKNQVLTNEVSFDRKAKEILLALRLERFFDKNEILEAYLNIIPYGRDASGRNIAGIQTAAQGIFGVDASEVNLPQAAYLAGLPQSPSAYTPFVNNGGLKSEEGLQRGLNRMKTVLKRMLDAEYINEKEYKEALAYDIISDFKEKSPSPLERYPYLTHEIEIWATEILVEILAEEDGHSMEELEDDADLKQQYEILANRSLRMDGYNIHSTIDKEIYDAMQPVAKNYEYYGPDRTVIEEDSETGESIKKVERVQTGGFMLENSTGRIISFIGGRGHDLKNQINYATNAPRANGSTMKPILDYGPAMEKGYVQPGTPIADYARSYSIPGQPDWKPKNYGGGHYGIVSARKALASSYNVPAADTYLKIIQDDPATEYLEKMGFTSLTEADHSNLALSLGAMQDGVTIEENTNAFSTLGNNGKFVDAFLIDKITTNDGEVIYEHKPEAVDVYSPQTNYLTVDMMRDVIRSGTAHYLNSQLKYGNVDWAGKTGTTDDYWDAWFIGVNPHVTFGTWIGYDTPANLKDTCHGCSLSYSQRNLKLWAELINAATEVNPDLLAPKKRFERPDGIVERSYCAISGMLPSELCKKAGLIETDIFNVKYVPTEVDDSLIEGSYVLVDGKAVIAGPNTPSEFIEGDGLTFNPEFLKRNGYDKLDDLTKLFPRTNRHLWEKIGVPSGDLGDAIKDDGKKPAAPTSLKGSGNKLTWKKSGSKDVVGYRIYKANKPGDAFSLIGNTIKTEYSAGKNAAVYHVVAVDYFGLESSASNEVIIGEIKDSKDEEKENGKDKDENKDKDKGNDNGNDDNKGENDNGGEIEDPADPPEDDEKA